MNQLWFRLVKLFKMIFRTSVLWKLNMHMAKKWTEMVKKPLLLIILHLFRLVTVQFFFCLSVSIYSLTATLKLIQPSERTQKCLKISKLFFVKNKAKCNQTLLTLWPSYVSLLWKNEKSCRKPPTSFLFIHKKLTSLQ